MDVSIVVATYGADEWDDLAWARAYPSADIQGAREVVKRHESDGTLAEARNAAARDASGEWLCFLDADDELAPGYLEAMTEAWFEGAITTDWSPLLVPSVSYVDAASVASEPRIPQKGGWPKLNECVIGTLVRRLLFLELGGFRDLPSLEDYDLWLRCFDAGAQLVYVPAAVYLAYVNPRGGRNADQSPYAQVWADHLARGGAIFVR